MPKATLRVRRKGTAMVPHYESHPHVRRFHGWKYDATLGEEFEHPETKKLVRQGGFDPHDQDIEVPDTVEYRRHLRDGDLWPADQATATAVGIPFDRYFGHGPPPKAAPAPRVGIPMVADASGVAHGELTVTEESPVKDLLPELTEATSRVEQTFTPAAAAAVGGH